jgi:hypothetical protein
VHSQLYHQIQGQTKIKFLSHSKFNRTTLINLRSPINYRLIASKELKAKSARIVIAAVTIRCSYHKILINRDSYQ